MRTSNSNDPADFTVDAVAKSVAIADFKQQLRSNINIRRELLKYIESNRNFVKYSNKRLFDSSGRLSGIEERWQLDDDQLWEFLEHQHKQRSGWRGRLRKFFLGE
jgi:hypothetical protein